jgi:hypothetical protein
MWVCTEQYSAHPTYTALRCTADISDAPGFSSALHRSAASSISFANTFGVLFTVVFYDLVVVPVTNKIGRPISMTFRYCAVVMQHSALSFSTRPCSSLQLFGV